MRRRVIVVPVIRNSLDQVLLCRMPPDRGVFPGQWGLPGGGIEAGESMTEALRREVREELGISVTEISPLSFRDDVRSKLSADGSTEQLYLIYLLFQCRTDADEVQLNEEFDAYAWVSPDHLSNYDLNPATEITFDQMGLFDL